MKDTVLVATIGKTDPICGEKDGPVLHIVRHYQPKKVYLICSGQIWENERKWHSNERAIHMLKANCEVKLIDTGIQDVHSYDTLSNTILKVCSIIKKENSDKKILLNISSGTPQMNTVFCLLAMSDTEAYLPIQVAMPIKTANKIEDKNKKFEPEIDSLEDWFELNEDNEPEQPNRCIQPKFLNFSKPVTQFQIKSLIKNYDYSAAHMLYEMNQSLFTDNTGLILLHAKRRLNLEYKEATKLATQLKLQNQLYPVKQREILELMEFYLSMNIKQKRGELNDMILRLEIITEYIANYMLKNNMKISIESITEAKKKKNSTIYYTSEQKAEKKIKGITQYLNGQFSSNFEWKKPINARTIVYILKYMTQKSEYKKYQDCVNELEKWLNVVGEVRNPAAHTIMAVTDKEIRSSYGKDSKVLMEKIQHVLRSIFGKEAPKEAYSIYDTVNQLIIKQLQEEV